MDGHASCWMTAREFVFHAADFLQIIKLIVGLAGLGRSSAMCLMTAFSHVIGRQAVTAKLEVVVDPARQWQRGSVRRHAGSGCGDDKVILRAGLCRLGSGRHNKGWPTPPSWTGCDGLTRHSYLTTALRV